MTLPKAVDSQPLLNLVTRDLVTVVPCLGTTVTKSRVTKFNSGCESTAFGSVILVAEGEGSRAAPRSFASLRMTRRKHYDFEWRRIRLRIVISREWPRSS